MTNKENTVADALLLMQTAIKLACEVCPQLRSVGVSFNWVGDLNSELPFGFSGDKVGPLTPADMDALRTAPGQTLMLLDSQVQALSRSISLVRQTADYAAAEAALESKRLHEPTQPPSAQTVSAIDRQKEAASKIQQAAGLKPARPDSAADIGNGHYT